MPGPCRSASPASPGCPRRRRRARPATGRPGRRTSARCSCGRARRRRAALQPSTPMPPSTHRRPRSPPRSRAGRAIHATRHRRVPRRGCARQCWPTPGWRSRRGRARCGRCRGCAGSPAAVAPPGGCTATVAACAVRGRRWHRRWSIAKRARHASRTGSGVGNLKLNTPAPRMSQWFRFQRSPRYGGRTSFPCAVRIGMSHGCPLESLL